MSGNPLPAIVAAAVPDGWSVLEQLRHFAELRRSVDDRIDRLVGDLRLCDDPTSWAVIGDALGVSRQAAQQRYAG